MSPPGRGHCKARRGRGGGRREKGTVPVRKGLAGAPGWGCVLRPGPEAWAAGGAGAGGPEPPTRGTDPRKRQGASGRAAWVTGSGAHRLAETSPRPVTSWPRVGPLSLGETNSASLKDCGGPGRELHSRAWRTKRPAETLRQRYTLIAPALALPGCPPLCPRLGARVGSEPLLPPLRWGWAARRQRGAPKAPTLTAQGGGERAVGPLGVRRERAPT